MLETLSKLIEHEHTDEEIKAAAMAKLQSYADGGIVTVISNSGKVGSKRVSIFLGTGTRVYCNDLFEAQTVEGHRGLIDLMSRFRASDRKHFVTLK